jgi:hypothetical protein
VRSFSSTKYGRWYGLLCVSVAVAVLAASCSSTHDTADVVPPLPGAFQPDAGGKLIDEATACADLVQAEASARTALGCDAAKHECPSYIRPAGGAACFLYDKASLDGCTTLYASFTSCAEFEQRPCLLTAESNCDSGTGVGAGGAGGHGSGGAGGEPDGAGEAGVGGAGTAGAGG